MGPRLLGKVNILKCTCLVVRRYPAQFLVWSRIHFWPLDDPFCLDKGTGSTPQKWLPTSKGFIEANVYHQCVATRSLTSRLKQLRTKSLSLVPSCCTLNLTWNLMPYERQWLCILSKDCKEDVFLAKTKRLYFKSVTQNIYLVDQLTTLHIFCYFVSYTPSGWLALLRGDVLGKSE